MTTYSLLNIIDGAGDERIVRAEYNTPDNSYAFHEVVEVNGVAVSTSNRFPVDAVIDGTTVNADGGLNVHVENSVTILNPPPTTFFTESVAPLEANSSFTSSARALPSNTNARYFYATVYSDQASATNGFQILGFNGIIFLPIAVFTTVGNVPTTLQVPLIYSQYKVSILNNSTAQSVLWVQSGFAN